MISITLASHTITLSPPQRLLMLEILQSSQRLFKILHESGYEDESTFELLATSETTTRHNLTGLNMMPSLIPKSFLDAIPAVDKLDLRALPPQYSILSNGRFEQFMFEPGTSYSVVLLSEFLVDRQVNAD
jgi:hypothetical protein